MVFQMIHIEVAYRLLNQIPQIKNPAEFILGSVAPDSVHMNLNYDISITEGSFLLARNIWTTTMCMVQFR